MAQATNNTARLKTRYEQEIRPELIRRFSYSTPMQAPKIKKITLNMGVGDAKQDTKALEAATEQLATIAGQRPNVRRARKSIAAFKLREGMPVGVSVTLRGERSYEFLDRLMSVAIPRIRDFRGMNPRSFDGRGNYSLGVREQIIFPEIDYDTIDQTRGLDITITTSAATDVEAFALLALFGFPFAQEGRPVMPGDEAEAEATAEVEGDAARAGSNGAAASAAAEVASEEPAQDVSARAPAIEAAQEPAGWGEEPGAQEDFTGAEEASREPEDVPGEADGETTGRYVEEAAAPDLEAAEAAAESETEAVAVPEELEAVEEPAAVEPEAAEEPEAEAAEDPAAVEPEAAEEPDAEAAEEPEAEAVAEPEAVEKPEAAEVAEADAEPETEAAVEHEAVEEPEVAEADAEPETEAAVEQEAVAEHEAEAPGEPPIDTAESAAAPAALDSAAPVNDVPAQEPASKVTEADDAAGEE